MTEWWRFEPNDTLFFPEARPMNSIGDNRLDGRFPPGANAGSGAVRSVVGSALDTDWVKYQAGTDVHLNTLLGNPRTADDRGRLRLTGPFPMLGDQRLFPFPAHWLKLPFREPLNPKRKWRPDAHRHEDENGFARLLPGAPVCCDLGNVRLPEVEAQQGTLAAGAQPLEDAWVTEEDLVRILNGEPPTGYYMGSELADPEARLGIARNAYRTAEKGLLYQTQHVRPRWEVGIGVGIDGLDGTSLPDALPVTRFGGEGRFAFPRKIDANLEAPCAKAPARETRGIFLMLLTDADFGVRHWLPETFNPIDRDGVRVWKDVVAGQELVLECAILGRATREGGWDMARNRSRPVRSLVPAGSVYLCTCDDPAKTLALIGNDPPRLGRDQAIGRGEIVVGYW